MADSSVSMSPTTSVHSTPYSNRYLNSGATIMKDSVLAVAASVFALIAADSVERTLPEFAFALRLVPLAAGLIWLVRRLIGMPPSSSGTYLPSFSYRTSYGSGRYSDRVTGGGYSSTVTGGGYSGNRGGYSTVTRESSGGAFHGLSETRGGGGFSSSVTSSSSSSSGLSSSRFSSLADTRGN